MSETASHLVILAELEKKARKTRRNNSDNSMRYSSKRRSRRDQIQVQHHQISSKTLGSGGNATEATVSSRSFGSDSSDSLSSYENTSDDNNNNALSPGFLRVKHLNLMDELQEKVARMDALASGTRRRSRSGNWRRSSRRSHSGSSSSRSSSLGDSGRSERSGSSSGASSGSGRSHHDKRSRSSSRRSAKRGTKQKYARRRSSSPGRTRSSRSSAPRDDAPTMPSRSKNKRQEDGPPSLPSRSRRPDSPEKTKELLKWTAPQQSSRSPARRRSPSNGAGSANGSFQVTQRKNIALSSSGTRSRSRGRRRSQAASQRSSSSSSSATSITRDNSNPDLATIDSEDDPLENISIPGAFSVHSSGQISQLSSPSSHHQRSSTISLDGSVRSSISSLSSSSSHHHRQSLDGSTRSSGSSGRGRRSSRHRRSLDSSVRSSCSSVHSRSSLQSWPEELEEEEDDDDLSFAGENTLTSRSRSLFLMSVDEEPAEPLIAASVTRDLEEELEEARAQGRREALNEVTRNNSDDIVVVMARSDDEDSQGSEVVDEKKRRKVLCWAFLLCCLLLVVGIGATALLFVGKTNGIKDMEPVKNEEVTNSTLKGIIIYTPPTQEECDAIANGTLLEDQQSLIQRSFDIQIDITLAAEGDFGSLVADMIRHIQQKLLPVLAGCQAINFFDATIAITDGITGTTNTTAAIANGQVQQSREFPCETDPIGNCKTYVLILDLYLEEEKSNVILLEAIGETVTSEDIANTLGVLYPVQSASVSSIEHLIDDGTATLPSPAPQDPVQDSGTSPPVVPPTTSPVTSSPIPAPTAIPVVTNQGDSDPETPAPVPPTTSPVTSVPIPAPTAVPVVIDETASGPVSATAEPATSSPVNTPTETPTHAPSKAPTSAPTSRPTKSPTKAPTRSPTARPTKTPTELQPDDPVTSAPTKSPTVSPTVSPTRDPTRSPTASPTVSPTRDPTGSPTPSPTTSPTLSPTKAPTSAPTETPVLAPTGGTFCCSKDFLTCGGDGDLDASCMTDQASCESCNNAAWIELGTCSTGLGRNDDCSSNPTGCCAGTCQTFGSNMKCRV